MTNMTKQPITSDPTPEPVQAGESPRRRTEPRNKPLRTHCLTITAGDRFLVALLVDHSSTGLGIHAFEPFALKTVVSVSGTVQVGDDWMELEGSATTVYCEPTEDDLFRVGLEFSDVEWRETGEPQLGWR